MKQQKPNAHRLRDTLVWETAKRRHLRYLLRAVTAHGLCVCQPTLVARRAVNRCRGGTERLDGNHSLEHGLRLRTGGLLLLLRLAGLSGSARLLLLVHWLAMLGLRLLIDSLWLLRKSLSLWRGSSWLLRVHWVSSGLLVLNIALLLLLLLGVLWLLVGAGGEGRDGWVWVLGGLSAGCNTGVVCWWLA